VPRFEPFAGVRYDPSVVDLQDVVAPPYDVIGPERLAELEARSPYNVVHVDLSHDDEGRDRYAAAGCRFDEWLAEGVLLTDPEPAFYAYRMGYHDPVGRPHQTVGVMGAVELSAPGEGDVLPHERTLGKAKDDRLRLLRACRTDLSPIWGMSLADGLTALCSEPAGPPLARCTDDDGVHHRLWRLDRPAIVEAVAATVASAPVVIADGHHRYETALAFRDEQRAAGGGARVDGRLLAFVSELGEAQESVRPIHRVITGLPEGFDLVGRLEPFFDAIEAGAPDDGLPARMEEAGALGLVLGGQKSAWLLLPRHDRGAEAGDGDGEPAPDAALLDEALAGLPPHTLAFEQVAASVTDMVAAGRAQAGVLLRPVPVSQIARTALAGRRMPEKTTYFQPKPRTGMLFRRLDG
jgi:uncharacterized protein (DUF1015 family)